MKKIDKRKLAVKGETIRILQEPELAIINGGLSYPCGMVSAQCVNPSGGNYSCHTACGTSE